MILILCSGGTTLKNKFVYDHFNDLFIQEIKGLNKLDLEQIDEEYQVQLDEVAHRNKSTLATLETDTKRLKQLDLLEPSDALLKDIFGLCKEEQEYIENIQNAQQTQDNDSNVQKTLGKQHVHNVHKKEDLEDAVCQICNDGDYQDDNQIVFCAVSLPLSLSLSLPSSATSQSTSAATSSPAFLSKIGSATSAKSSAPKASGSAVPSAPSSGAP